MCLSGRLNEYPWTASVTGYPKFQDRGRLQGFLTAVKNKKILVNNQKGKIKGMSLELNGRGDWIRTSDLSHPKRVR